MQGLVWTSWARGKMPRGAQRRLELLRRTEDGTMPSLLRLRSNIVIHGRYD